MPVNYAFTDVDFERWSHLCQERIETYPLRVLRATEEAYRRWWHC